MLEELRKKSRLAAKNATWLEGLLSAESVELYRSSWCYLPEHHEMAEHHFAGCPDGGCLAQGVVLDYYSLIGLDGDPTQVIPLPVLVRLIEDDPSYWETSAVAFLKRLRRTYRVQMAGVGDRHCAVNKHDSAASSTVVQHSSSCDCSTMDCSPSGCNSCSSHGCRFEFHCGCGQEWTQPGEPNPTPCEFEELSAEEDVVLDDPMGREHIPTVRFLWAEEPTEAEVAEKVGTTGKTRLLTK